MDGVDEERVSGLLVVSLSSSVVPFSLSRQSPSSNSPYQKITLKTNKKIFNERAR
jgi:hypothetical protein